MTRWKYGNYEFGVNPNGMETSTELVGDNVRTLSGATISQPSFLKDSHSVTSVFYQPRSRAIAQAVVQNSSAVCFENEQLYVLNRVNDRIDVYSSNLSNRVSSVSLSNLQNKNYVNLDVVSNRFWLVSSVNSSTDSITQLDFNGNVVSSGTVSKTMECSGIRYFNGYLWLLRTNGNIEKIRTNDFAKVTVVVLPYELYYSGLSSDSNFLIVGNRDSYNKLYHVDTKTGKIINQIYFDKMNPVYDVTFDGKYFYTINQNNVLQKIDGNTVECDLHLFQYEIENYAFVNMITDMGVSMKVMVSNMSIKRRLEFEHMYEVSMTITKVDRG
ncbi:hypothetical protein [Paenibacillus illinoisensis]|uniref:hypothetical protein n=1 Tax=Paenibacillus illinoisensis TaxID=59845 RepID=UPI003019A0E6